MTRKTDAIYRAPLQEMIDFQFDERVVAVFPDMIQRSVPGYGMIISNIGILAAKYAQQGSHCYDLGCSLGAVSLAMRQRINQPDCDMIGFGVSSIGRVGATYSQNAKTLEEYYDFLDQGQFPIVRGLALSRDDLVRRGVIMALMCQGRLSYESIESAYLVDFKQYFAKELETMAAQVEQGLVTLDDSGIQVTTKGWFFVRAVAMVFDRYLQTDRTRTKFSKIL